MTYDTYAHARALEKASTPEATQGERHLDEEIAAVILAGGWTRANALDTLLKVEALLRPAGTKGRPPKGIYLAVRPAEPGRSAMIVIRGLDGQKEKTTNIPAKSDDEDPNANPLAFTKLLSEINAKLRGLKARIATEHVPINNILLEYVAAKEPKQKTATDEQHKVWLNIANAGRQLMEFFRGTKVRDFADDAGDKYWKWRSHQPLLTGAKDDTGKPRTPMDLTVATHLDVLRAALRWYVRHYRARVRIEFKWPDFPEMETAWWTWDEVVRLLYAAMGLKWDKKKRDWKRKTAIIGGEERQVFDMLSRDERERYKPLIRFILIYFFTGTRFKRVLKLGWKSSDLAGCIHVLKGNAAIWRKGRKERRNRIKPAPKSEILEIFRRKLEIWRKQDERLNIERVIHQANGDAVPGIRKLFNEVARSVGLETKPHRLKHSGVTNLAIRGFTLTQISQLFGTTSKTLRTNYLHIDWDGGIGPLEQEEFLGLKKLSDVGILTPSSGGTVDRPKEPRPRLRAA